MRNRGMIKREVEETLRCLDGIETIEADPLFYTRLMAKIESCAGRKDPAKIGVFALRPLRPVFLALLVALNVFSATWFFGASDYQPEIREDSIEAFARAYSLYEENNGA